MTKAMKEILRKENEDNLIGACELAKKVGYTIECYDGDGESGMCEPEVSFSRN